jgi:hypothetical protein
MSRCATLALILSVTACEHAQPMTHSEPKFEARPAPTAPAPTPAETAPAPTPEPAVAPVAPKPTSRTAQQPAEQPAVDAPKKKLVKKCNPMSRAGCRWSEEVDERLTERVTKKPAGDTTTEGSAP